MEQSGINEIVVHAPYIVNLGSYKDSTYELAVSFYKKKFAVPITSVYVILFFIQVPIRTRMQNMASLV